MPVSKKVGLLYPDVEATYPPEFYGHIFHPCDRPSEDPSHAPVEPLSVEPSHEVPVELDTPVEPLSMEPSHEVHQPDVEIVKTGQPADRPVAPEDADPLPLTDSVNVEVESYLKHTYTPDFGQVGLLLDFEPRSQPKLFQFVVR